MTHKPLWFLVLGFWFLVFGFWFLVLVIDKQCFYNMYNASTIFIFTFLFLFPFSVI